MLDNTPNQPSRFRTKVGLKEVMMHMELITKIKSNQIKVKTSILKSNLFEWITYILVSWTITIDGADAYDAAKRLDERNKGVIF